MARPRPEKHKPPAETSAGPSRRWRWLFIASAVVFAVLASHAAWVETPTIDEFAHVPSGCVYWKYGRFDLYAKNPPLWKMVMALPVLAAGAEVPPPPDPQDAWTPWTYGQGFAEANREQYFRLFWLARMCVVLAGLACGVVLYFWCRDVFDERAAAITAALFYLNPNVLAHGHLATIDIASAATILLALYALRTACRREGWLPMALAGLAFGAALLVKFTAVLMLPVAAVYLTRHRWKRWRRLAADVAWFAAAAWLGVNAGMAFQGSFQRLDSYSLVSQFGQGMQQSLPGWLPVPLPRSYVEGFDLQKRDTEMGEFGSYLLGRWSSEGWWYYNLVALVVKNPLVLTALIFAAGWSWRGRAGQTTELMEIVLPTAVLALSMMAFNRLNIGIRYLLPLFPLLLLFTGAIWQSRRWWQPWLAAAVLIIHAVTAAAMHPEHLRYFNWAAGGPSRGHLVLLDSNLDWGQDLYRVPAALDALDHRGPIYLLYFGHVPPALYGIEYSLPPVEPSAGVWAVSVQYVMGGSYVVTAPDGAMYNLPPGQFAWLARIPPTIKAGSIWIYDLRHSEQSQATEQ